MSILVEYLAVGRPRFTVFANDMRNELNANGWHVTRLLTSTDGLNSNYERIQIQLEEPSGTSEYQVNVEWLLFFQSYFSRFYSDLSIQMNDYSEYTGYTEGLLQTFQNIFGGGEAASGTYTVRAGDTFTRIANKFHLSISQLRALNPQVTNINIIRVGQVLNVSGGSTGNVNTNTSSGNANSSGNYGTGIVSLEPDEDDGAIKTFAKEAGMSVIMLGLLGFLAFAIVTKSRE